jgi:16S rRNA (cytidine1402-2'-O)-methyltransferase
MLIAELQKEFDDSIVIAPIPGASALISALSVSGFPAHTFTFMGFVPHKKGRESFFKDAAAIEHTVVFYESVHRIIKTLESLAALIPDRAIVIARELTKLFEEVRKGTCSELYEYYTNNPDKIRGEFVVILGPEK